MDAGLIPIRSPHRAKTRLASTMNDNERAAIVGALITDALELATSCTELRWFVITDDDGVERSATEAGVECLRDDGQGLNEAISSAVSQLEDASALLVVPMDVPLVTCNDVRSILEVAETSDMVIVPSIGDGGTNGLLLRPPGAIPPAFGENSLERHVSIGESHGLRTTVLPLSAFAVDLDSSEDIPRLLKDAGDRDGHTLRLLRAMSEAQDSD